MTRLNKANILTIAILLLILAIAASGTFYYLKKHQVSVDAPLNKALSTEEGAPGFTDMNGNQLTLSDHFGKPLVVTSWASWCPQCAGDLPQLAQIAKEYSGQEVAVLAINRAENKFTAERFLSSIASTEGLIVVLDSADHFFVAHEGYAMPETILYDKKGEVVLHQRGVLRADELKAELNKLLEN